MPWRSSPARYLYVYVAIPVTQIKDEGGKFVLPGATKEAIKALPKFEYAS